MMEEDDDRDVKHYILLFFVVFFFKQKTAYEIGQWLEFRRVLFRSTFSSWTEKHWNHPSLNREPLEPSAPRPENIETTIF